MKTPFDISPEEFDIIFRRAKTIASQADGKLSIRDNLRKAIADELQNITDEDCVVVADKLIKGVTLFNREYETPGYESCTSLYDECMEHIQGHTNEEQAICLLNTIALLKTMDASVIEESLNNDCVDFHQKFDEFRNMGLSDTVSEVELDDLKYLLREAIENNTLCVAGIISTKEVLSSLETDSDISMSLMEKIISDYDYTCYVAVASYLAYKNGEIQIGQEDIDPELLAESIAAGMERARVAVAVESGSITWDEAISKIKRIGHVLLKLVFYWIDANLAYLILFGSIALFASIIVPTGLGLIVGLAIGGVAVYKGLSWFTNTIQKPIHVVLGKAYDRLAAYFKVTIPVMVERIEEFWNYLMEKASILFKKVFLEEDQLVSISS